jgi:hypothetical protein
MYHAYRYFQILSIHLYTAKYVNVYNMNTYTPIQANTLICTYAIHNIGPEIAKARRNFCPKARRNFCKC